MIIVGLAVAGTACDLYWGTSTQKTGPSFPDAATNAPDGGVDGGGVYPDGGYWNEDGGHFYPDAANCGGYCPDAAYLPDACTGP